MAFANRAPRYITILIAIVLVVIGWLGTFGNILPDHVGAWLHVAATAVLLAGVFLRGL